VRAGDRANAFDQRKPCVARDDEAVLSTTIVKLASENGRNGSRRIIELLQAEAWRANANRVRCIWRREGLRYYQDNLQRQDPDHGGSISITGSPAISSPERTMTGTR